MKLLVACEYSGVVRDAFAGKGWNAWSCDTLPTESIGNHYQSDVLDVIDNDWDLIIAHPPCTYLCSSGLHWNKRRPGRQKQTNEALNFVSLFLNNKVKYLALENPIGCISSQIRKPDQIIQPWQFGHPESKSTCLWLKNLPKLTHTNVLSKPKCGYWDNQTPSGQNKLGPSSTRAKERSKTYEGFAAAMAEQWTNWIDEKESSRQTTQR